MYGLVAPGYEMARDGRRGDRGRDEASFTGADLSTKLKLLGVDVASFGDAHGAADGCLDVVYSDSRSGVYKKLVIGRGRRRCSAGSWSATPTRTARCAPLTGSVPPVAPEQLVLPAGRGRARSRSARPRCPTTR